MPAVNPYMTAAEYVVANTAFPALNSPTVTNDRPGVVSVAHLGILGDPAVYVSFDGGVTTAMILRAGTPTAAQSTQGASYKNVWLRVASGSVNVYVNLEDADAGIQP